MAEVRGRSGGKVEQHLIGAKLEERLHGQPVSNLPANAGDSQTARAGDFMIGRMAFHITATPGEGVVERCLRNIDDGIHPVLIVPAAETTRARTIADLKQAAHKISIVGMEEFLTANILELALEKGSNAHDVFSSIIDRYNRRLLEVETDHSLTIELQ